MQPVILTAKTKAATSSAEMPICMGRRLSGVWELLTENVHEGPCGEKVFMHFVAQICLVLMLLVHLPHSNIGPTGRSWSAQLLIYCVSICRLVELLYPVSDSSSTRLISPHLFVLSSTPCPTIAPVAAPRPRQPFLSHQETFLSLSCPLEISRHWKYLPHHHHNRNCRTQRFNMFLPTRTRKTIDLGL